jgi:hypothetical protein
MKIYRRELAVDAPSNPSVQRTGIKITNLNMPGGRGVTEIDERNRPFFVVDRNDANTNVTETR